MRTGARFKHRPTGRRGTSKGPLSEITGRFRALFDDGDIRYIRADECTVLGSGAQNQPQPRAARIDPNNPPANTRDEVAARLAEIRARKVAARESSDSGAWSVPHSDHRSPRRFRTDE